MAIVTSVIGDWTRMRTPMLSLGGFIGLGERLSYSNRVLLTSHGCASELTRPRSPYRSRCPVGYIIQFTRSKTAYSVGYVALFL